MTDGERYAQTIAVCDRLRRETLEQVGQVCDCKTKEVAINPERKCSRCGGFIWFDGEGDGWVDFWEWRGLGGDTDELIEQQLEENRKLRSAQ